MTKAVSRTSQPFELSLFCAKVGDAWRVYVWPGWLPGYLRDCFDANGEAFPVYLDLDELDRQMEGSEVVYTKIESPIGGYELTATGEAATVLSVWLSQSFASGKRLVSGATGEVMSTKSTNFAG